MKKIAAVIIALLIVCQCFPFSSEAAERYGKKFQEKIEEHHTILTLKGLGVKSYFFIKIFVAGFYTSESSSTADLLNDVPKKLEVAYFYNIPGAKLAIETRRRIILNTTAQEFNQIKDRVNVMDSYFVDLRPGDRYVLTYIPKEGTTFTYNGKVTGTIKGADFAKALFAVWIGKEPIDQTLKNNLLGLK